MGRDMKNKKSGIFAKILVVIAGCALFASFSPSLDGRAVVVEEGVFPQGLFAKTVGYLPGDIITVANISGDSTVDLLVIGALDPSEGVAIMLTPEAANAIGIDKDANNIVKITKRSGNDERVYGTAVIARNDGNAKTNDKKGEEYKIPENQFEEIASDFDESEAEDEWTDEPAEENPASEEEMEIIPATESDFDESENEESEIAEEEEIAEDEEADNPFARAYAASGEESEEEPESEDEAVAEEIYSFDEENEEEMSFDEEEEPQNEVAEEELLENEEISDLIEEEPVDEGEISAIPFEEQFEEPVEEVPETPVEEEVEVPADSVEEDTEITEEAEVQPVEEAEESYEAIVLVPSDSMPPAPAESEPEEEEIAEPAPVVEKEPEPVAKPASKETSYEKYIVSSLSDLKKGYYYIQVASLGSDENIMNFVNKYAQNYPVAIVPKGSVKQIMVGPVNMDEYGVVLDRFKKYGFKDAFVRKIK